MLMATQRPALTYPQTTPLVIILSLQNREIFVSSFILDKHSVNLIIYAEFQNVIETDASRNVLYDYTN